jgi:hypothetical protein
VCRPALRFEKGMPLFSAPPTISFAIWLAIHNRFRMSKAFRYAMAR